MIDFLVKQVLLGKITIDKIPEKYKGAVLEIISQMGSN